MIYITLDAYSSVFLRLRQCIFRTMYFLENKKFRTRYFLESKAREPGPTHQTTGLEWRGANLPPRTASGEISQTP